MKRKFTFGLLLLVAVTFFASCRKNDMTDQSVTDNNNPAISTGAGIIKEELMYTPCTEYSQLRLQGLDPELAKLLAASYQQDNKPLLSELNGSQDASSIWFSLETLKSFIWHIETAARRNSCTKKMNLGVRIYYARYKESLRSHPDLSGLPLSYNNCHTAFIVPTYQDSRNIRVQHDFDPWHMGSDVEYCPPLTMEQLLTTHQHELKKENALILSPSEPQAFRGGREPGWGFIQNHGSLVPPDPVTGSAF
jgi:hypothetical protein